MLEFEADWLQQGKCLEGFRALSSRTFSSPTETSSVEVEVDKGGGSFSSLECLVSNRVERSYENSLAGFE